jgi:hypothetical protein
MSEEQAEPERVDEPATDNRRESLAEYLARSPLPGSGLVIERGDPGMET